MCYFVGMGAVSCCSKKQKTVASSTTDVEYNGFCQDHKGGYLTEETLGELGFF